MCFVFLRVVCCLGNVVARWDRGSGTTRRGLARIPFDRSVAFCHLLRSSFGPLPLPPLLHPPFIERKRVIVGMRTRTTAVVQSDYSQYFTARSNVFPYVYAVNEACVPWGMLMPYIYVFLAVSALCSLCRNGRGLRAVGKLDWLCCLLGAGAMDKVAYLSVKFPCSILFGRF